MTQKLEEQEETALNIAETYISLQQEVEVKTKKLKKVTHIVTLCCCINFAIMASAVLYMQITHSINLLLF